LGGTCVNSGCTPTKSMVASARVAALARRGASYGIHIGSLSVDLAAVRQRKLGIVEGARSGFERQLTAAHAATQRLDLLRGAAHFIGPKTLEVQLTSGQTRQVTAPQIFLYCVLQPERLTIPGIERVPVLDSTSIMELTTVPDHLLIIGSGYIGLEFGQMFQRFGSQVTLIQRNPRVLMREDEDVSEAVAAMLREEGISILTSTTP